MERVARKTGKLLKGGEPDIDNVAKMVLNDWQRGKLPFFTPPPGCEQLPKPEGEATSTTNEEESNAEISEAKEDDATDAVSEAESSASKVLKDQDFRKIRVVLDYDEDDRRGDPALADQPVLSDSDSDEDEEQEESPESPAKKAKKVKDSQTESKDKSTSKNNAKVTSRKVRKVSKAVKKTKKITPTDAADSMNVKATSSGKFTVSDSK